MARWRRLARYDNRWKNHQPMYCGEEWYCGGCGYHVDKPYTFPSHIDDHERDDWYRFDEDRELWHFRFCPWCGAAMDEDSARGETERLLPPDHMNDPGSHVGDEHEFVGSFDGHVLDSSDGSLCWCEPEVERSLFKCVIRHQERQNPRLPSR